MEQQEKPKIHKTLNQKLKKKREKLKLHKKQKKMKHQQYDKQGKKALFFQKGKHKTKKDKKKDSYGIKVYKLKRQLNKFTRVYEDELQDFYEIWKNLDDGGQIEIDEIQNQDIKKCMKHFCKYLLLMKNNHNYKKSNPSINLQSYVKKKMQEVIQEYLQNGTESSDQSKSEDEKNKSTKIDDTKVKKEKKKQVIKKQQISRPVQIVNEKEKTQQKKTVGPSIPNFERQQIQLMFQQTLKSINQQKRKQQQQEDQLDKIFGYQPKKKIKIQKQIPDHLYATGSAKLQDQTDCQQAQIHLQQYNKKFRGKSLMQQHQQLLSKGAVISGPKVQRKPFTRQSLGSDKVDTKRLDEMLQNGSFFDFKDRMSKPVLKKSFL